MLLLSQCNTESGNALNEMKIIHLKLLCVCLIIDILIICLLVKIIFIHTQFICETGKVSMNIVGKDFLKCFISIGDILYEI